ncbi:MAG: hypothetical protein JSU86_03085 [Phycisphaerales bacterium]|nr:MAG: hypothetical protein JSU86_03085 [Phycisphaerales bacterium]
MFSPVWTPKAQETYDELRVRAETSLKARRDSGKRKATKDEGLFKQVHKCIQHLLRNPKHPGLVTHEYHSLTHPYDKNEKVFEAYAQHKTPGAYRVFWCYGPQKGQITIVAITPHP